jgi:hypothetical protein
MITVKRSGGLDAGMTVAYSTANGTVIAAKDYTAASGTLTFAQGVVAVTFPVLTTNDKLDESNETVNLALSNPGGGAVLGTRRTAVLTIVDNDAGGTLNFSVAAYERSEAGGIAVINVVRGGGAAGASASRTRHPRARRWRHRITHLAPARSRSHPGSTRRRSPSRSRTTRPPKPTRPSISRSRTRPAAQSSARGRRLCSPSWTRIRIRPTRRGGRCGCKSANCDAFFPDFL